MVFPRSSHLIASFIATIMDNKNINDPCKDMMYDADAPQTFKKINVTNQVSTLSVHIRCQHDRSQLSHHRHWEAWSWQR